MTQIITRFPPSPTGYLHVGGARTALFNWLLARKHGGKFVLRIEDTDMQRSSEEMTKSILDAMEWLGLDWDDGPYYQSKRFDLYNAYIERLLANGSAYYCECTPDEVEAMREEARAKGLKPKYNLRCRERNLGPGPGRVVRFKSPLDGKTVFDDMVKGPIGVDNAELDDMVIRRADCSPTYNLAVVADDVEMKITHVLRGDDHINNTPKQILLYHALGEPVPLFGHVPMILGPDKKKLSKRHGATSVMVYKEMGYLPESLVNYLVRLGWSYGDREIFSLSELVELFSVENLGKSAGVFNQEKLLWLNAHYIKEGDVSRLAGLLAEYLHAAGLPTADAPYLERIVPLLQARAGTMVEMAEMAAFFVKNDDELEMDQDAFTKFITPQAKSDLAKVVQMLGGMEAFSHKELEDNFKLFLEREGTKFKALAQPLRICLTGKTASPGIFETMEVLGKEKCLRRIRASLDR